MSGDERGTVRAGYDVVVVGGGAAGLSGALTLARARRSVLVVDAGAPRNAPADAVHNYLGREGTPPLDMLAQGRREVAGYGGTVLTGTVRGVDRLADDPEGHRFRVRLDDGRVVRARRLRVTAGLVDELPPVPGLADRWGRDVLHCPFCHGREVAGRRVGVLATSPVAVHQALMWRSWTDDVVLLRHPGLVLDDEQAEQLAARGVAVVDGEVTGLELTGGALSGVRLADGRVVAVAALVVFAPVAARAAFLADLGLATAPLEANGVVLGTRVPSGPAGATDVPGLRVAGSLVDPMSQVIAAAASGLTAAAALVAEFVAEENAAAVEEHRARDRRYVPA